MLRFAAAAATSLMLLTSLSGCGGDPPAAQAQPSRTPTSPSSSPTPTPPALPAAAKRRGASSAKAFVRHYIEMLNYATFTGDVSGLRHLGTRECGSCRNVVHGIRAIYRKGGHVDGGAFRIKRLNAIDHPADRGYTIDVYTEFGRQKVYRRRGSEPDRYKAGANTFSFILAMHHGWIVSDWSRSS